MNIDNRADSYDANAARFKELNDRKRSLTAAESEELSGLKEWLDYCDEVRWASRG